MLSVEDANKIIAFLSAAYLATEDAEAREEFHRLANEAKEIIRSTIGINRNLIRNEGRL